VDVLVALGEGERPVAELSRYLVKRRQELVSLLGIEAWARDCSTS
jgi:hypothetical protein